MHRYSRSILTNPSGKIVCVMVGLPARGKTYIARKLSRYLNWLGIQTQVFNVGDYRRQISGAVRPHAFFDPANTEAEAERHRAAEAALIDLCTWLEGTDGEVAVFDATNTNRMRREWVKKTCDSYGFSVLFIESVCNDEELEMENIMQVKIGCPDYASIDQAEAIADFKARIAHYREIYESLGENESEAALTFVKLINVGAKAIINRIMDYRQSRIVFYLMNLHIKPRSIYLCRHGETEFNRAGRIGGDADLSENGRQFAMKLPELLKKNLGNDSSSLVVWTSTLKRTIQTVEHLPYPKVSWKALDEIDAGVCETLTYEEIAERYPEDFAARDLDKFHYRYPNGESYADLVHRLEPVIMELERQNNILIVGHQAVLRAILAYFLNKRLEDLPYIKIPLHLIVKLTPKAYGCQVEQFQLDIEAVDTHRAKPTIPGHLA